MGLTMHFIKALQEEAEDFGIELRLTQPRGARVSARAHLRSCEIGARTYSEQKTHFLFSFFFLSDSVDGRVKVEDGKREWFERGWDVRKL